LEPPVLDIEPESLALVPAIWVAEFVVTVGAVVVCGV